MHVHIDRNQLNTHIIIVFLSIFRNLFLSIQSLNSILLKIEYRKDREERYVSNLRKRWIVKTYLFFKRFASSNHIMVNDLLILFIANICRLVWGII